MKTPILTKAQKIAIILLAKSPLREKFYWTGGTLLAYHYLQHRKSLDIDLFSDTPFTISELNTFTHTLRKKGGFKTVTYQKIFDRFEFLFVNQEPLRIEFVYYNGEKKQLQERQKLLGVSIDSFHDIAANKVMAYFDRNEPKDLFDIYFLVTRGGFSPRKLLELVYKKFGLHISESSFWSDAFKSLPLLKELIPLLLEETVEEKKELFADVERYFKDGSSAFMRRNLR